MLDYGVLSVGGRLRSASVLFASVLILMLLGASAAQATTWVVTNTGDAKSPTCPSPSSCTLRGAVNSAANGDVISLPAGAYTLNGAEGPIKVETNLSIVGAGSSATTITASPASELVYVESAEVNISGVTFHGGSVGSPASRGAGGAIYNEGGNLKISASAFTNNTANGSNGEPKHEYGYGGYGGAIYNEYGDLTVTSSSFTGNTANGGYSVSSYASGGYGGAIDSEEGDLTVTSSSFTGNTVTGGSKATGGDEYGGYGGAIYVEDGHAMIAGDSFGANSAQGGATAAAATYAEGGYGGAIFSEDAATDISASTISGNTVTGGGTTETNKRGGYSGYGGGLYAEDGTMTVAKSTISGNTVAAGSDASGSAYGSGGYGGGLYAEDGSVELSGDTVTGNTLPRDTAAKSTGYGGGVFTEDGAATIAQSTISENQAPGGRGAGLVTEYGSTTVTQSVFGANLAPGGEGGAIMSEDGKLALDQSTVGAGNTAEYGAGIYHEYGPLAVTNTTIADNTASEEGGGIYNEGVADLANVSLVANTAQSTDGGGNLYLDEYTMTLHDSLIAAGVSPTSGGDCAFDTGSGYIASDGYNAESSNECTLGGPGNQLNATLDLGALQSNGGLTPTIALGAGSQAIDAGDPSGCTDAEGNPLTVDQRGVTRPQGARCDIGAFEVEVPAPAPTPTPTPTPAPKPTPASITSFATSIGVKLSSGVGTLTAGCGAPTTESCTFTLTLYASVKGGHASSVKRVKVGAVSGKVQGGHVGKLTVKLNATGRKYLAHGTLHLEAKGTVKDSAGLITQLHRHVTIKAAKKKK